MRIRSWQFRPRKRITTIYLLLGISMLLLGRWQMLRAFEKIELSTLASHAQVQEPVLMGRALVESDGETSRSPYTPVTLTGTPVSDGELTGNQSQIHFLWDNRIHKGQAGYEVITPFLLADGAIALVNRGWVPLGISRQLPPDVSLPVALAGPHSLAGVLTFPSRGFARGEALEENDETWPRLIQYLDYNGLQDVLADLVPGGSVIPGLVQGTALSSVAEEASSSQGLPNSKGLLFVDNWQPVANGPEKHYAYAAQWFAMLLALSVLFFWLNSERVGAGKSDPDNSMA